MLITFDEQLIQDFESQCYSLRGGWVTMVQIPRTSVYKDDVRKTVAKGHQLQEAPPRLLSIVPKQSTAS